MIGGDDRVFKHKKKIPLELAEQFLIMQVNNILFPFLMLVAVVISLNLYFNTLLLTNIKSFWEIVEYPMIIFNISLAIISFFIITILLILKRSFKKHYNLIYNIIIYYCFFYSILTNILLLIWGYNLNYIIQYFLITTVISYTLISNSKLSLIISTVNHLFFTVSFFAFNDTNFVNIQGYIIITMIIIFSNITSYINHIRQIDYFISKETIIQKNKELELMASKDGLTDLYNRRFFDKSIRSMLCSCIANKVSLSIVMLDVDNFKLFNDTFGHQVGDDCLIRIGKLLINYSTKNNGLAFRYGGEEFVMLFSNFSSQDAFNICESLRKEIENIEFNTTPNGTPQTSVSISIYHTYPDEFTKCEICLKKADNLLYDVKKLGKNKTFIYKD